ncbi:S9 family peptidase [Candidatus Uabimicrobium amorphum]|uniref:Peptidase S9 n=1 Tax=Uabimicrobium amorphum TaxID=2596890 RepID=A0A5S9F533_UABAM|nr:S9 family peptidase [Candidatus Uabimicrobium amorphum]BBM85743.1 peptidase S9 [Candidatus Uabimicrobium amorphum]
MSKNIMLWLCICVLSVLYAQNLTLEDIYHPQKKIKLSSSIPSVTWLNDQEYLQLDFDGKVATWYVHNVKNEQKTLFYSAEKMSAAFAALPGITKAQAQNIARRSHAFNSDKSAVLVSAFNDLFYYKLNSEKAIRLTQTAKRETVAHFSPDGAFVSFIQDNDLYIVDIATQHVRSLTKGGGENLFNARLDWVYQEEIYGRGNFKGYWWSPDGTKIAYLQLNETPVNKFTVVDHIPYRGELEVTSYPKAGDPNPSVRLGVINVAGGSTTWIDTFKYEAQAFLIVQVGWLPDSERVYYKLQNREQTWLDFNIAQSGSGKSTTVLRETSSAWVRVNEAPIWLADDQFLWCSDRSGFKHLYLYKTDGKLIKQLTTGEWEIKRVYGYDEKHQRIYFSANKDSSIADHSYYTDIKSSTIEKLTLFAGNHRVSFSKGFSYFFDYWSNVTTPTQLRLYDNSGKEVKKIAVAKVENLRKYKWGKTQFHKVKTRDGFVMDALMIKPVNFDATKKYPVFCYTYSGPHAPSVRDSWRGSQYLWHQMLAQKGYIIWICDNRTASARGMKYTWQVYRNFGELELRDLEDGLTWLKKKPFVDSTRIGMWGWSYGGYMTSYALTNSKSFKIGIAGAPVTDWRDYDSVYTERYMAMPQNNTQGYLKSSPTQHAKNLHGNLLIIHGTMDDNVHLQNTIQFIYELQKANKKFSLMLYPRSRHGVRRPSQRYHLYQLMTDFVINNL